MGRPKDPEAKSEAVQVRLQPELASAFDKLVTRRKEGARAIGAEVTRTTVLRALIEQALAAEGLLPGQAPTEPTKKAPRGR